MESLELAVVGPGRAGGAVALAAMAAGHHVAAVVAGPSGRVPEELKLEPSRYGSLPLVDLVIVATPDREIHSAAKAVAARLTGSAIVCHLSGFTSIDAVDVGTRRYGSLHPLMSLPDPVRGMRALSGAPAAVTGSSRDVSAVIEGFARSIGMRPFHLSDDRRRLYHAAASVASNMTAGVLGLAFDLIRAADVDPSVLRPLVAQSIANVFELGPAQALTGPIARGDESTVAGQRLEVELVDADLADQFDALVGFLRSRVADPS
jgi:predicted short-subunit dehydrogenase-like oxidoreductase (DUF2520 family)